MSEVAELADKLKSEGDKLALFFAGLTGAQWKQEGYTEGTVWTVRNILPHPKTAERAFIKLFERIQQGGPGSSEDFSIDRYNAVQQERTRALPPQELLEQYKLMRAQMIEWVSGIQDADLEVVARHPYLGVTTL